MSDLRNSASDSTKVVNKPLELSIDDADSPLEVSFSAYKGLSERIIPPSHLSVTAALAACPPVQPSAQPMIFSDQQPKFVSELPNTLIDSPATSSFDQSFRRLTLDLLWASRHASSLQQQLASAQDGGARSIQFSPNHRLPLWVVSLLVELHSAHEVLLHWDSGFRWLSGRHIDTSVPLSLVETCRELLTNIRWSMHIPGYNSAVYLTMKELASFLSSSWLNDSMINAGLDWIIQTMASNLAKHGEQTSCGIMNCYFLTLLSNVCEEIGTFSYSFRQRSQIDNGIRSGKITTLEVPAHVNGNHWAGFSVNIDHHTYSYRDSLLEDPPQKYVTLLEQYLGVVLATGGQRYTLTRIDLPNGPLARQEDSYSCGIAYLDSVANAYLGTSNWGPHRASTGRIEWFSRLAGCFHLVRCLVFSIV